MNIKNLDHDEVKKFDDLAAKWWDPDGEFKPKIFIQIKLDD